MKKSIKAAMLSLAIIAVSGHACLHAAVSSKINFQGQMTKANGSPVTDTQNMTFNVYDSLTGGTLIKSITSAGVTFSDKGLYNVQLDFTGINLNQSLFLGIKVGSDDEMTPRVAILPSVASMFSPSASNSDQLGGITAASYQLKSGGTGQLNMNGYAIITSSSIEGLGRVVWADGSVSTTAAHLSGADMTKSTYDTDGNNVVDNAEKLGSNAPGFYLPATVAATTYLTLSGGTLSGAITSSQGFLQISTNVYTVGYSSAGAFFGDGSNLNLGRAYGESFMNNNLSGTAISPANQFFKVSGATSGVDLKNFTESGSNRLTYTGTKTGEFKCIVSLTASVGIAGQTITFAIAKGASVIAKSQLQAVITAIGDRANVTVTCLVQLSTNDYIELWVTNTAANPVTVTYMNMNVTEIE